MEDMLSYDQLNHDYSMLMNVLCVSVSRHLMDEHFTCIWANDYYYELIQYPKPVYEARFHNHCDEYYRNNPEGWNILTEKVTEALENGEEGFTSYIPMVRPDHSIFWVKLQAAFTKEYIDGYLVSYTTMTDVTELMNARIEREHTQQAFDKMTHEQDMLMTALNVSVSKHLIDDHFTCVWANEFYYKLIGYPKPVYEARFHNCCDQFYYNNPGGWQLLVDKVTSVLERGEDTYEVIVPMKYEDGSSYWVKLVSFFTDEYINGVRTSYTVMTDVTHLVQMQNEQDMLMSAMKVSVSKHLVDEYFTVVWANEFYYSMIGYTKEEYEARFHNHCNEYFKDNSDSWTLIQEKVNNMLANGEKGYETYLPLKQPDGSTSWVKMIGFFTDEYQDGSQLAYTTMVDITNLMQTQKERSIAYDNIPGFIVKYRVLPQSLIILDASERLKDIFDVDMERLSEYDALGVLQPQSRRFIENQIPRMRRGEPFETTVHVQDKLDRERWFQINCTCIDFIADDPVYLTVFIDITDITELRELQRKLEERTGLLNEALKNAEQANRAKSDFLSRMSHDIRTPMNVIAGMTEIADTHLDDKARVKDCLDKIRLSSRHLLGLINDVLDMSKIENGSVAIQKAPNFLPEVLREVIMITRASTQARHQTFDIRIKVLDDEQYLCDALRLRQIFLNLLSNAAKFTPEKGRIVFEVEERLTDRPDEPLLCFTVSDNGVGMKADFLEHIFDPFTREQDSRTDRIEGSGLGMAITKRLVDMLHGTITVHSAPGSGTVFQVILPMQTVPAADDEPLPAGINVLFMDSSPATRKFAERSFQKMGVGIRCVSGAAEAAASITSARQGNQDYTLVILDDPAAANELHRLAGEALPRLILSTYDKSADGDEADKAGIHDFIDKPLFRSTLSRCIKEHPVKESGQIRQTPDYSFNGKTFLLAEDNMLNREIALELLGRLGAHLETAENGAKALQLFTESTPGYYDLILMDIQMPIMNGYEAARAIRALPRSDAKTVPILAMTADAFVEDIKNAEAAGMNGHMAKPLDYQALGHKISSFLKERQP